MSNKLLQKIENPGAEFRGAPFWAWNGKLEENELREQIRMMKAMGLGGFFMHSRVGLGTPYLSEEWFRLVGACIDEAKKLGMKAWLYDEDRWPSGAAGGIVTKDKRWRVRYLQFSLGKEFSPLPDSIELARFAVRMKGGAIVACRRLGRRARLAEEETLLVFRRTIHPGGDSWFNGQCYLNTLDPEAVKRFIAVTHEAYRKRFAREFGKTVPGIFTDEPNFGAPVDALPWTDRLPELFRKRFGYDLIDHLPELFFEYRPEILERGYLNLRDEFSKARLDYRNLLADTFADAFCGTIGRWCDRNKLIFTGHVLLEDTMRDQCGAVGSAMRSYLPMSAPGIDLLTEHWNVFITARQCTSVAHQLGRRMRLTETYGCTGWDFPFMGHKALGDWQYALGINFRCQHLTWYTMAAEAKRDYPASISAHSPWWREYRKVEDYFARLCAALSEGEEVRELLVIHPIESFLGSYVTQVRMQGTFTADHPSDVALIELTNALLSLHLDFDFGEESVMAQHGAVAGQRLKVGGAAYRAVLIPPLATIRSTTLALLERFADRGGDVRYLGAAPERVDGEPSGEAARVFAKFHSVQTALLDQTLSPRIRRVSICDADGEIAPVLALLKQGRGFETLFVCNTGCDFTRGQKFAPLVRDRRRRFPRASVAWLLPEGYRVYRLDLETGRLHRQEFEVDERGVVRFAAPLEALESRLYFATAEELPAAAPLRAPRLPAKTAAFPDRRIKVELDEPNVLVLDTPAYRVDGGPRREPTFCLALDRELRAMLGARPRGGSMVQPWLRGASRAKRQLELELEYTIRCDAVPKTDCELALERPDLYAVTFNGKPLDMTDRGWWCDKAIRRIAIPAARFRRGVNRLVLVSRYDETLPGLESLYLLGDFGVKNDVLTSPVRSLKYGDWTKQGLPYYAGNLTYRIEIPEGVKQVEISEWRGVALAVARDDEAEFEVLGWPPFVIPVKGAKTLRIKVLGHRRNAMGPFRTADLWPQWTGPAQFLLDERKERGLVPCGLLEPPRG